MSLQEWKSLCREAWEYDFDCSQTDRFAKVGEDWYTLKSWNKTYLECTPQTKPL